MEEQNKYSIALTEEIITLLGFGEYWDDSGSSGTRYLIDPDNPELSLMRIHDVDEDSYEHYPQDTVEQHFTSDDWEIWLWDIEDLLKESEKWKGATELLLKNLEKLKQDGRTE